MLILFFILTILIVLSVCYSRKKFFYGWLVSLLIGIYIFSPITWAMQSTNYQITEDSVTVGGIESSSSTSYSLKDTIDGVGGNASSSSYGLRGGYRSTAFSSISISTPSNVTLSSCAQAVACSSDGTVNWTVTTDNVSGYALSISASTAPALKSGSNSFTDFTPSGTTGFWSVGASASAFGFAVGSSGQTDIVSAFKDDGASCGSGSGVGSCYRGFSGSTAIPIVSRNSSMSSGNTTTLKLKAQIGSNYVQPVGTYTATITATAIAL
jgi:hypothetical protein